MPHLQNVRAAAGHAIGAAAPTRGGALVGVDERCSHERAASEVGGGRSEPVRSVKEPQVTRLDRDDVHRPSLGHPEELGRGKAGDDTSAALFHGARAPRSSCPPGQFWLYS